MSGFMIAIVVLATIVLSLYGLIVRSTAKENARDTLKLAEAWVSYYGESQKFNPIKEFIITYANGDVDKVEGRSFTDKEDHFTINDEHGKITVSVMKARLISIKTQRQSYYVKGER